MERCDKKRVDLKGVGCERILHFPFNIQIHLIFLKWRRQSEGKVSGVFGGDEQIIYSENRECSLLMITFEF